jgi:hypothetical protein
MRDYVHRKPGEETRSVPLFYTVREEGRMDLDGRAVLYLVGETQIGSACVGAGVLNYIFVQGYVLEWHAAVADDGSPVSRMEPITDDDARARVCAILAPRHPGLQVCF